MPIYIYNSLTRKKEEFIPLRPPKVNIYSCGVTVYDESHIGHARSLYIFDLVRRYLEYRGFKVRLVRNITDIDDKIINKAIESGISWKKVTKKYIAAYRRDLKLLRIKEADFEPRASDNIKEMVGHIRKLVNKGYAYVSGGDVYFRVRKFSGYGKLSGQSIEEMVSGARPEKSGLKRDPLDFALWKSSKAGEPYWASPWGRGRPGWHIECSAMSLKYLKADTLDIHAGGRDLIFPHHENEIAQSEALSGRPFAKYWMHHGLLTINSQKMAKSLENFISIKDILKSYSADTLKMLFLGAHYASPVDFSEEKMRESAASLERITIFLGKLKKKRLKNKRRKPKDIPQIRGLKDKFIQAMDDDFNTSKGLAVLFDLVNLANKNIDDFGFSCQAVGLLKEISALFGLVLDGRPRRQALISEEEIKAKIARRQQARQQADYGLSDKIRKELEGQGVLLEDTKEGTSWRYKI